MAKCRVVIVSFEQLVFDRRRGADGDASVAFMPKGRCNCGCNGDGEVVLGVDGDGIFMEFGGRSG